MTVQFTQEAEIKRVYDRSKSWELHRTTSLVEAVHKAREMGWKDKKVQVRLEKTGTDMVNYYVEPFEKDCGCPSILRYSDFFD